MRADILISLPLNSLSIFFYRKKNMLVVCLLCVHKNVFSSKKYTTS